MGLIEQPLSLRFTPLVYTTSVSCVVMHVGKKSGDPNRGALPLCVGNRGWSLRSVTKGRYGASSWLRDDFVSLTSPAFLLSVFTKKHGNSRTRHAFITCRGKNYWETRSPLSNYVTFRGSDWKFDISLMYINMGNYFLFYPLESLIQLFLFSRYSDEKFLRSLLLRPTRSSFVSLHFSTEVKFFSGSPLFLSILTPFFCFVFFFNYYEATNVRISILAGIAVMQQFFLSVHMLHRSCKKVVHRTSRFFIV